MDNEQSKKQYTKPEISELGQVNDFVQMNGLYGMIDGSFIVIYNMSYAPHQST